MAEPVIVTETPEALATRVSEDFTALVESTLAVQNRMTVALAGGMTPKMFYAQLAAEPYRSRIPWEKLWFFWGDERCVPKDHPESNFRMAYETLLSRVPVPAAHVLRIKGEEPPPVAARDYEKEMRALFANQEWPTFDFMLLGLGPDGHTASLIPGTPAIAEHPPAGFEERRTEPATDGVVPPRWVVANVVRALQTVRITMTLPAINHARHIWFLVTGVKKAAAFERAQRLADPACPASLVEPVDGELRWYVDKAVMGTGVNL
jgi:6-phosphogluconolactonase